MIKYAGSDLPTMQRLSKSYKRIEFKYECWVCLRHNCWPLTFEVSFKANEGIITLFILVKKTELLFLAWYCNEKNLCLSVLPSLLKIVVNLEQIEMSCDMTKPTSAQSYQSLRCPHEETLGTSLPTERTAKTLIRLGGCPGWSESLLGAHSFCWFVVSQPKSEILLKVNKTECWINKLKTSEIVYTRPLMK